MARLKKIIILGAMSALVTSALIAYSVASFAANSTAPQDGKIHGIIVPHHLLVEKYIDELYKLTSTNRNDIKRVILLSPNHFNYGYHYTQGTDKEFSTEDSPFLDEDFIKNLSTKTPLKTESKYFEKEHGIMVELPFISKYFPKAEVVPIIIKGDTPKSRLDSIIDEISKADLSHTLIIASIDFTHYEAEKIAIKNDSRIISWLEEWNKKAQEDEFATIKTLAKSNPKTNKSSVAMDSPESFYVFVRLMENLNSKNFSLYKRTSSASLVGIKDPLQNTSHIFGIFKN